MPGSVSDSYHSEFGTGENARIVAAAIEGVIAKLEKPLKDRKNILEVAMSKNGEQLKLALSEREWRLVRYALHVAWECI